MRLLTLLTLGSFPYLCSARETTPCSSWCLTKSPLRGDKDLLVDCLPLAWFLRKLENIFLPVKTICIAATLQTRATICISQWQQPPSLMPPKPDTSYPAEYEIGWECLQGTSPQPPCSHSPSLPDRVQKDSPRLMVTLSIFQQSWTTSVTNAVTCMGWKSTCVLLNPLCYPTVCIRLRTLIGADRRFSSV